MDRSSAGKQCRRGHEQPVPDSHDARPSNAQPKLPLTEQHCFLRAVYNYTPMPVGCGSPVQWRWRLPSLGGVHPGECTRAGRQATRARRQQPPTLRATAAMRCRRSPLSHWILLSLRRSTPQFFAMLCLPCSAAQQQRTQQRLGRGHVALRRWRMLSIMHAAFSKPMRPTHRLYCARRMFAWQACERAAQRPADWLAGVTGCH